MFEKSLFNSVVSKKVSFPNQKLDGVFGLTRTPSQTSNSVAHCQDSLPSQQLRHPLRSPVRSSRVSKENVSNCTQAKMCEEDTVTMPGELGNRGGQCLKIWYEKSSPSSNRWTICHGHRRGWSKVSFLHTRVSCLVNFDADSMSDYLVFPTRNGDFLGKLYTYTVYIYSFPKKKRKIIFFFLYVVHLQQIKKKAKTEGKTCHAKTMLSLEKPIKLL